MESWTFFKWRRKLAVSFSGDTYKKDISKLINQSSQILAKVTINSNDFSFIEPKRGDFVYFDPPYYGLSKGFYTQIEFDEKEQIRLAQFAKNLSNNGVKIMISNSNHPFIC